MIFNQDEVMTSPLLQQYQLWANEVEAKATQKTFNPKYYYKTLHPGVYFDCGGNKFTIHKVIPPTPFHCRIVTERQKLHYVTELQWKFPVHVQEVYIGPIYPGISSYELSCIQHGFQDPMYYNLTLLAKADYTKPFHSFSGYEFVASYCPNINQIIKNDTDLAAYMYIIFQFRPWFYLLHQLQERSTLNIRIFNKTVENNAREWLRLYNYLCNFHVSEDYQITSFYSQLTKINYRCEAVPPILYSEDTLFDCLKTEDNYNDQFLQCAARTILSWRHLRGVHFYLNFSLYPYQHNEQELNPVEIYFDPQFPILSALFTYRPTTRRIIQQLYCSTLLLFGQKQQIDDQSNLYFYSNFTIYMVERFLMLLLETETNDPFLLQCKIEAEKKFTNHPSDFLFEFAYITLWLHIYQKWIYYYRKSLVYYHNKTFCSPQFDINQFEFIPIQITFDPDSNICMYNSFFDHICGEILTPDERNEQLQTFLDEASFLWEYQTSPSTDSCSSNETCRK